MEVRNVKIMFNKDGHGSDTTKISLPIKWIRDMGISPNDREVDLKYDEKTKKIIIEKSK